MSSNVMKDRIHVRDDASDNLILQKKKQIIENKLIKQSIM